MPTSCRGFFLAVLNLLLGVAALSAEDATVSFKATGEPASQCLTTISTVSGVPMLLGPELLARNADKTPLFMHMRDASVAECAEAIAQGLGVWWVSTPQERIVFSDSSTIPLGPLTTLTRPTGIEQQDDLLPLLQHLLTPWLGNNTALTTHPSRNRIIATLDDAGHYRLLTILTLLEANRPQIPPLFHPLPPQSLAPAPNWTTLIESARDISIVKAKSVPTEVPPPTPVPTWRSPTGSLLVVTTEPRSHQHPAQRLQLCHWPIAHLTKGDDEQGNLLVAQLRSKVPHWIWTEPGSTITYWAPTKSIVIQCDPLGLRSISQHLTALDAGTASQQPE